MQPPADGRLAIDERLHAQAGAIHARADKRLQGPVGKLAGRAFDGDLGLRLQVELRPHGREQPRQQLRREQSRGSSAQVDRVHPARQSHAHARRPLAGCSHILDQPVHVARVFGGRINP